VLKTVQALPAEPRGLVRRLQAPAGAEGSADPHHTQVAVVSVYAGYFLFTAAATDARPRRQDAAVGAAPSRVQQFEHT
jgi:hypothetical protein